MSTLEFPTSRTAWFKDARFGMFIHWGVYSVYGRGEWAMSRERIAWSDYEPLTDQFTAEDFDPDAWARLAVQAGMRYMVLTTKHHEGFCLWDSAICSYNSKRRGPKRDIVAEFVAAGKRAGLKVGLYYSLGDWRNPDWAAGWKGDVFARERFMDYTHGLVRELMTNYGPIDILWYDLPQCYSPDEWRSVELNAMARSLQPHILINNRALTTEDFATPEQHVAASSQGRLWESCMTLNDHWGYCPTDTRFKTPAAVAYNLATIAAGGGNLLLNVGPDPRGRIPEASAQILRRVGEWLQTHGQAIYPVERHNLKWYLFGPVTAKGNTMYCHLWQYYGSEMTIGGLIPAVKSATLLTTGTPVAFEQRGPQLFLRGLPKTSPDELMTVIKLELEAPPSHDLSTVLGGADIFPDFPK